ncbi:MAG: sensor histidine kinase [Lysobacter sp.]
MAVATVLAWQALAAPALVRWLQPLFGASAALVLVFALATLAGGAALTALLRARALAPADTARLGNGTDHGNHCERQLLALAKALPIGALVLRGGRIVTANPIAVQQLRLDPADWSQRPPAQLFADPAIADAALTGTLPLLSSVQLRRGGGGEDETFRAVVGVHDLSLDQRRFRVLLFDDLTESDRLDARLQQQNGQLLAVAGRLITVQEDERRTLSRELHDDIGQAITAIKLGVVSLADQDPSRQEIVDEVVAIADQTVAKLRDLSMLLRPPQLDTLGLEAAVRWQAQTLLRGAPPALELAFTALLRRPDPAVELACFRIVQEALTNVLRYAGASRVRVALAADGAMLTLAVSDDGCGFTPSEATGLGLVIMRERAQLLGGRLQVETAPGAGTTVRAQLPMTATGEG